MAGKELELLVALKGQMDKSLPESVRKAAVEAAELQKKMDKLNSIKMKSEKYRAMAKEAQELGTKFSQAQKKAEQLGAQFRQDQATVSRYREQLSQAKVALAGMSRGTNPEAYRAARANVDKLTVAYKQAQIAARASKSDFERAASSVNSSGRAYHTSQMALSQLSAELRQAGFYTEHFASSQIVLQHELERTKSKLSQAEKIQEQYSRQQQLRNQSREAHGKAQANFFSATGNLMAGAYAVQEISQPIMDAVHAATSFESAMADVKKVVDFDTPQQFKEMQKDVLQLSSVLPMAAEDIAKIVAAGGQSGIAREDLMSFAESAVKMGIAFDVTADQAGDMMAKWRTAFKMNQEQVVALADKVNYLGNTTAAAAPLISDVISRVGPLGEVGGVASGEIAALGASMIGVGVPSDVAATGIKNLILSMVAGESATKSQAAAFQSLGMDAAVMAKRMQTDAKGAILDVFNAIQGLDADKQASTLQALFGKESLSAISPLLANLGNLKENFDKVSDATKYAGSMEAEYAARSKTTENQIQLAKNALKAASIEIGTQFLPIIGEMAGAVAENAKAFAKWAGGHKEIIVLAGAVAAVIAGVIMTALTVNVAVSGWKLLGATFEMIAQSSALETIGSRMGSLLGTVGALPGKISSAVSGFSALGRLGPLLANPYVLAAAAIVVLIGAIALLSGNFEKIKETAAIVFSHISGTVGAWVATIQAKFAEALNKITDVWNSVTGQSLQSSEMIGAIINNLGFVLGAAFDIAAGLIGNTVAVIINLIASVAQIVGGVINIIAGLLTGDWDRAWKGAGQVVEGFASGTLGTIKTIAESVGSIFDTLMGKSAEVQKQAEQAKAQQDLIAKSRSANINADYMPDEGMMQTAQAAQQTAQATAEASAHAQTLSANVEQGGAAAQQTADYMKQLQEVMGQVPTQTQAAFSGMGEQSAAAAQAVNASMQQIPMQTQATFQQLPPMVQQGTDAVAQEFSQLAAKCQPGGDAFVQAANQWGQQAYESIANWSGQMASAVVDRLSNAWAQISAQFSAGLNVNVTTSVAEVAHNAAGGIYGKGAFLTTFAETSPEAAIPLDGSSRAVSLWQRAGQMLGVMPESAPVRESSVVMPLPVDHGGMGMTLEFHGSPITINGNADSGTLEEIRAELERQKRDFQMMVERAVRQMNYEQRRTSYA